MVRANVSTSSSSTSSDETLSELEAEFLLTASCVSEEIASDDPTIRPMRGPVCLADRLDAEFEQNYRFEGITNVLAAPRRFLKNVVGVREELEDSDFMKKR